MLPHGTMSDRPMRQRFGLCERKGSGGRFLERSRELGLGKEMGFRFDLNREPVRINQFGFWRLMTRRSRLLLDLGWMKICCRLLLFFEDGFLSLFLFCC